MVVVCTARWLCYASRPGQYPHRTPLPPEWMRGLPANRVASSGITLPGAPAAHGVRSRKESADWANGNSRITRRNPRRRRNVRGALGVHARGLVARALDVFHVGPRIEMRLRLATAGLAAAVPARGCSTRAGTRGRARRRSSCLRSPSGASTQHLLRRQIEVVRRLVQHQEVRRVAAACAPSPGASSRRLTARGSSCHVVARELERAGEAAQHADRTRAESPSATAPRSVRSGSSSSSACWAK